MRKNKRSKRRRNIYSSILRTQKHKVDTAFATLWGDDGAETNVFLASSMLPIFSEACWQGADCEKEEMILSGECLTGMPRKVLEALGEFYPSEKDVRTGKSLIWCDPLFPMLEGIKDTMEDIIGAI